MEADAEQTLALLKGLADASRLRILGILADNECSVHELAELLALTEPTVSHHLAKLQAVGLVRMRAAGTTHFYRLDAEALREVNRDLLTPTRLAALSVPEAGPTWEQLVLRTFVLDGRLTAIPESRKKRQVILHWLAAQFDEDVEYPEVAVNALIALYHPDTATLRRELIAAKLMTRAGGVYRRLPAAGDEPAGGE